MMTPNEPAETPTVNALLVAERVYRDGQSGNWIIAGVFNTITVSQLPWVHDWMEIFFQVTNVSRPVDLRLHIEHAADANVVVNVGGNIAAPSPLKVIEAKITLRYAPFPKAGKYWVQLTSHQQILSQAPLYVLHRRRDETPAAPGPDAP